MRAVKEVTEVLKCGACHVPGVAWNGLLVRTRQLQIVGKPSHRFINSESRQVEAVLCVFACCWQEMDELLGIAAFCNSDRNGWS
jgi:hypothetical protein